MGYISHTAANAALNGLVGDDNTLGATIYIGLSSTEPTLSGGAFSGATEPSTGSYARVAVTNDNTSWTVTAGAATNDILIEFPEATADWDVEPEFFCIYAASSGGNPILYGELTELLNCDLGDTVQFEAGQLTLNAA